MQDKNPISLTIDRINKKKKEIFLLNNFAILRINGINKKKKEILKSIFIVNTPKPRMYDATNTSIHDCSFFIKKKNTTVINKVKDCDISTFFNKMTDDNYFNDNYFNYIIYIKLSENEQSNLSNLDKCNLLLISDPLYSKNDELSINRYDKDNLLLISEAPEGSFQKILFTQDSPQEQEWNEIALNITNAQKTLKTKYIRTTIGVTSILFAIIPAIIVAIKFKDNFKSTKSLIESPWPLLLLGIGVSLLGIGVILFGANRREKFLNEVKEAKKLLENYEHEKKQK